MRERAIEDWVEEVLFLLYGQRRERLDMERLPKRTNLVQETAATLKDWISRGVLTDILPGELQLKARLGVGRDTLRLALRLLEDEGWVSSASQGQQRRVQSGKRALTSRETVEGLPVTFLSPHRVEHRITLLEMEDTQLQLAEQGRNLHFISPDIFHLQRPDRRLEHLVRTHPSAAWVLYVTNERIQRWFQQQQLPTFLYEQPYPGVSLPYVVADWEAAAFHAGIQLVRQGHRVVGVLEYQERRPGIAVLNQGLKRALATASPEGRLLVFRDNHTPISVARALELAFGLQERPTALVLTYAPQLLTCYSWMVSRGIRIPQDLSVISLPNDAWFTELYPPLCYYQPDTKAMSRQVALRIMELVNAGHVTRKSIRIAMHYVLGATIGPIPGG